MYRLFAAFASGGFIFWAKK